jgi:hypothetical protein
MPKEVESGSDGTAIRPLTVSFPETELTELRRRIKVTRWPERETVTDATQGVQLAMPHARRHPRQHHDHLVDEHGAFWRPSLLGEQARLFQCQRRFHPCCRERLSRRAVPGSAKLGRAGVSQIDPLQQARQRRTLCGLGTAAALVRRGSRGLQAPPQSDLTFGRRRAPPSLQTQQTRIARDVLITIIKSNGRRVSVHWFAGVLQSLCSPS